MGVDVLTPHSTTHSARAPLVLLTGLDLQGYAPTDLTFTLLPPIGFPFTISRNRQILDVKYGVASVEVIASDLVQIGEYLIQMRAAATGLPDQRSQFGSVFVGERMSTSPAPGPWIWAEPEEPTWHNAPPADRMVVAFWTDKDGKNEDGSFGTKWGPI